MQLPPARLAHVLSNRSLHLVLLPTEACNFRCFYCYEDFRLARMEAAVVRGVQALIEKRAATLEHLEISWFGGEPLLARDLIEGLLEQVAALRARHPALGFRSDMTTNAWMLTRPVFERLLGLGVTSYQISFDGPKEVHDRRRKRADGAGTFDRVWRNVCALREVAADFEVRVRVHVDRENQASIPELLEQCERAFGADERFKLFLRPLSRLGGPNDASLQVLGDEEGAVIEGVRSQARERGLALLQAETEEPICHAAWGNSFVIRANGRVNKCTVALAHPANDIGCLHEDGTLEIEQEKARPWLRGLFSGDALELLCPMAGLAAEEVPAYLPRPATKAV